MTQPIHQTNASGRRSAVRKTAFLLMTLTAAANRRCCSRRDIDHHQQLGRVDQRALQNTESHCRRNARSRPHGGRPTRYHLRKPRRRRGRTAQLSQDPASGPYRLQHGRSRGDAVCDPPSGQSAKGSHHFRPRSAELRPANRRHGLERVGLRSRPA